MLRSLLAVLSRSCSLPACLLVCLALTACGTTGPAPLSGQASAAQFCDRPQVHDARTQDRLLRFAAIVRDELNDSGEQVALISRSGIDLAYLGIRYSHSGVSVKGDGDGPWSVRQLYYACDEGRPRLYDQGIAGFLFNSDDAQVGYVSIVLLPHEEAADLQRTALDRPRALRLLAGRYSANAYPFSTRYQNCNQWVNELMATAWGRLDDGADLRERAQAWLAGGGYAPAPIDLGSHRLKFAAAFMPLVHLDDHPEEARYGLNYRVSLPEAMESFVRERMPQAKRIELCHDDRQVVIRRGWQPIAAGCRPEAGDRVIALG